MEGEEFSREKKFVAKNLAENFISTKFRQQRRLHFWLEALLKARCLLACYFKKPAQ